MESVAQQAEASAQPVEEAPQPASEKLAQSSEDEPAGGEAEPEEVLEMPGGTELAPAEGIEAETLNDELQDAASQEGALLREDEPAGGEVPTAVAVEADPQQEEVVTVAAEPDDCASSSFAD